MDVYRKSLPTLSLLLAGWLVAGLAHGRESLFPDLRVEDFPEEVDTVRFAETEASAGSLTTQAFHLRSGQIGFASLLTADRSTDPETGRSRLDVRRLDDECVAAAEQAEWEPEEVCAALIVQELTEGIVRFVVYDRSSDYQVQLTLAQDVADPSEWSLIPTGRLGEPQELTLRLEEASGEDLAFEWRLAGFRGERTIELRLDAELPRREIEVAGLSTVEAAALSALDLFDDVVDLYLRDREARSTGEIVDEGIWSPGDNDPSRCELTDVCGAEYQTCTATPAGGFWACNLDSSVGGWGGGFLPGPGGGGGGSPPWLDPDWRMGTPSMHPQTVGPQFYGLEPGDEPWQNYYLDYELTTVLTREDTVAEAMLDQVGFSSHVVELILYRRRTSQELERPAEPFCTDVSRSFHLGPDLIPVGDRLYHQGSPSPLWEDGCEMPRDPGIYFLRYNLDPWHLWSEGSGESNNVGRAHGMFVHRP